MDAGTGPTGGAKARWNALPRSAKWGLYAVAAIVLYFFAIEPALTKMGAWNARADTKEVALKQYDKDRRARSEVDKAATEGVKNYGEVVTPADSATRSRLKTSWRTSAEIIELPLLAIWFQQDVSVQLWGWNAYRRMASQSNPNLSKYLRKRSASLITRRCWRHSAPRLVSRPSPRTG